jgi:hypothetical protein
LEAESEKYSQALMEFCQRKYGLERGATRYAEVLLLADSLFVFANMSSQLVLFVLDKNIF